MSKVDERSTMLEEILIHVGTRRPNTWAALS